jgi:hypothetical protein
MTNKNISEICKNMNKVIHLAVIIIFTLCVSACGGGSGESAATISTDSLTPIMSYQVSTLNTANLAINAPSYDGTIDQKPIKLLATGDNTLSWIVPDLSPGPHTLTAMVEGTTLNTTFNVISAPSVGDPTLYVMTAVESMLGKLDIQISALTGVSGQEDALSSLQAARNQLSSQLTSVSSMSANDVTFLANFINSNEIANQSMMNVSGRSANAMAPRPAMMQAYSAASCDINSTLYVLKVISSVSSIQKYTATSIAGGLLFYYSIPTGGSSVALAAFIEVFNLSKLALEIKSTLDQEEITYKACVGKIIDELMAYLNPSATSLHVLVNRTAAPRVFAAATSGQFLFIDGQYQRFDIVTTTSVLNASFKSYITVFQKAIGPIASLLPNSWVTKIRSYSANSNTSLSNPADYSITEVSDPNISVSTRVVGNTIDISFSQLQAKSTDTTFTFKLLDHRDGTSTITTAILKGFVPTLIISPASLNLSVGGNYKLQVSAITSAGFAMSLPPDLKWTSSNPSIVSVDAYGAVAVIADGTSDIVVSDPVTGATSQPITISTAPLITSVAPLTGNINKKTLFTVYGSNLNSSMTFNLANCNGIIAQPGGSDSMQQFSCTPTVAGSMSGYIAGTKLGPSIKDFTVTVSPGSPPVLVTPLMISGTTFNSTNLTAQIDVDGTGHYLVLGAGSPPPSIADVIAGTSFSMKAFVPQTVAIRGLTGLTPYVVYFVAKDLYGSYQVALSSISFTTTLAPLPAEIVTQGGFLWTPTTNLRLTYPDAEQYCGSYVLNGMAGWSLPTKDQLIGLSLSGLQFHTGWLYGAAWSTEGSGGSHTVVFNFNGGFYWEFDLSPMAVSCVRPQ